MFPSCKYHLGFDVSTAGGLLTNRTEGAYWELPETCALDVADRGEHTLTEVGVVMGITRERARQIELGALHKLREFFGIARKVTDEELVQLLRQQGTSYVEMLTGMRGTDITNFLKERGLDARTLINERKGEPEAPTDGRSRPRPRIEDKLRPLILTFGGVRGDKGFTAGEIANYASALSVKTSVATVRTLLSDMIVAGTVRRMAGPRTTGTRYASHIYALVTQGSEEV